MSILVAKKREKQEMDIFIGSGGTKTDPIKTESANKRIFRVRWIRNRVLVFSSFWSYLLSVNE